MHWVDIRRLEGLCIHNSNGLLLGIFGILVFFVFFCSLYYNSMQVWKDIQTGKYFNFDTKTGNQQQSNKFGKAKRDFIPYLGGYSHNISPKQYPVDSQITIQPHRFDGYCQFPRPFQKLSYSKPHKAVSYSPSPEKIRHQLDKIPNPLQYLQLKDHSHSVLTPLKVKKSKINRSSKDLPITSIEDFKKLSIPRTVSVIKTKFELDKALKREHLELSLKDLKKKKIESRRKFKGFFRTNFKDSSDLLENEKMIIEKTNPIFVNLKNKIKKVEFKQLERKRKATRLLLATNY